MSTDARRLMEEWLKIHGTPEQRAVWREKSAVEDDHERRLRAVEAGQERLVQAVADLKTEAHETRTEQTAMLKTIVAEVREIKDKQTFEAGRVAGSGEAMAANISAAERRARWFFPLIGVCVGLGLYALESFIEDTTEPQEISATIEDAR